MFIVRLQDGSMIDQQQIENVPGIPEEGKTRRLLNPGCASKNPEEQDDFCSPVMQFTNPVSQSLVLLGRFFIQLFRHFTAFTRLHEKPSIEYHAALSVLSEKSATVSGGAAFFAAQACTAADNVWLSVASKVRPASTAPWCSLPFMAVLLLGLRELVWENLHSRRSSFRGLRRTRLLLYLFTFFMVLG